MKIALIGYGKMGQTIERIALERGHTIGLKITSTNKEALTASALAANDAAIEFTVPQAAPENVGTCLSAGIPVVSGTTGWNEALVELKEKALSENGAFLHASNFSIGVNIFFEINRRLAELMNTQSAYKISIEEIHHLQKKDAPSGTAITLADQIIEVSSAYDSWKLAEAKEANEIPIRALREEGVPGTHQVSWQSSIDTIDIIHTAHSRDGFALGAVLAAEFIFGKKGVFTMQDVLGI